MPEPSRLMLVEQLLSNPLDSGSKVRFLACVQSYDGTTATLTVRDQNASSTLKVKDAVVNVENVLENINHELLQVGAWVNIIGTLRLLDGEPRKRHGKSRRSKPIVSLAVDATMIWSAGAIKLDEYRSAVEAYRKPLAPG